MSKIICFLIAILCIVFTLHTSSVYAVNMESSEYNIQFGTVDIAGGTESSGSYNLSTSVGQSAAKEFQANGYIVKAGFQYIYSIIPFSFSVSEVNVNLGSLIPNTSATSAITLTVSAGGAGGYQITAIEDYSLQTLSGASEIPDTPCDSGTSCDKSNANLWTSNTTYGFGYNMSGQDIPVDFINSNYYRPFANAANTPIPDDPEIVMSSTKVTMPTGTPTPAPASERTHESTVTFKANIDPIQEAGSYQTVIRFRATPIY